MTEAIDPYGATPFSLTFVDDHDHDDSAHGGMATQDTNDYVPNFLLPSQQSQSQHVSTIDYDGDLNFQDDEELDLGFELATKNLPAYSCRYECGKVF